MYRCVVSMDSWPASAWIVSMGTFAMASREQNVCRSLWHFPFAATPARFSTCWFAEGWAPQFAEPFPLEIGVTV
jgi:hypothetical protein